VLRHKRIQPAQGHCLVARLSLGAVGRLGDGSHSDREQYAHQLLVKGHLHKAAQVDGRRRQQVHAGHQRDHAAFG
jgi:hypothetical protein